MSKSGNTVFPALRCRMGDWIYYVTFMSFNDIGYWVKSTTEVHRNRQLSQWIQRALNKYHADNIARYLQRQSERFFNAIVIGVYGGDPEWFALRVSQRTDALEPYLTSELEDHLERSIGLLQLNGEPKPKLFAIDGQHRVAGIKQAIKESSELGKEEVCAIFVAHMKTKAGLARTRRLFTTLNKSAKRVSPMDIVALDEDNGFAIVARSLTEEFPLLSQEGLIAFNPGAALNETDATAITSIIALYEIAKDIHPSRKTKEFPGRTAVRHSRPEDDELERIFKFNKAYWTYLAERVPEYRTVFAGKRKAGAFRQQNRNHLLFRPIGQRAFAGAVRVLMDRRRSMEEAVDQLLSVNLWLHDRNWHNILWDPTAKRMITQSARAPAEAFLLRQVGERARTTQADKRLSALLDRRGQSLTNPAG